MYVSLVALSASTNTSFGMVTDPVLFFFFLVYICIELVSFLHGLVYVLRPFCMDFPHPFWLDIDSRSNLQCVPLPFLGFQLFFLHPSFHMRRFCCGLK